MAGSSNDSVTSVKHINDITECPICNEMFSDPRVLPCVHTFCFECIAKWAEDEARGSKFTCPLCPKEFRNPGHGSGVEQVTKLPKNSFVEKVVNARKLSSALSVTDINCDVCCDEGDGDNAAAAKKAVTYCVECNQNICQLCSAYHRKLKTTSDHKLVDLRENRSSNDELPLLELPENKCEKHNGEILKLYCHDCKLPLCTKCLVVDHKLHSILELEQLADEMRVQLQADIVGLVAKVDECRHHLAKIANIDHPDFYQQIETTSKLVNDTAEKMKQAIDNYKARLLDELKSAKMRHEKKVESMRQELESTMMMVEVFKHYSEQLGSRGTACDVVTSATRLHSRTNELIRHSVCRGFPRDRLLDIKFSSEFSNDHCDELHCLFGKLCIDGFEDGPAASTDVKLTHVGLFGVIPSTSRTRQSVTGVTTLGDDLFVICQNAHCIDIYDAGMLKLRRSLPIKHFRAVESCLAACKRNKCIYVSTCCPHTVLKIYPGACDKIESWPLEKAPNGIAVNRDTNLLITFSNARKLGEYTTDGKLIREIVLQSDVTYPRHTVQLTSDTFGVTHVGSLHRFCVIGSDGGIIRSFGGSPGMLVLPHGMALNARGDGVFVADKENHRILLLNLATLNAVELHIEMGSKQRLKYPFCVSFCQAHGRLYIGERGAGCRVIVVAIGE